MKQIESGWCNITSAYLDSSPDDSFLTHGKDRWHTVVFFSMVGQLTELVDRVNRIGNGLGLSKWHNSDRARGDARRYRRTFMRMALELAESKDIRVRAFSFLESGVRSVKVSLISNLRLIANYVEWHNHEKDGNMWATFTFPRKVPCSMPEAQSCYILMLAEIIGTYRYDAVRYFADKGDTKPVYLDLCIDKLSGDTADVHWNAHALQEIITAISDGWIGLSMNRESDVSPGDLLVDNMCGWLNSALEKPRSFATGTSKVLSSFGDVFTWHVFTQNRWVKADELLPQKNRYPRKQ
jgi:hypothetical protein